MECHFIDIVNQEAFTTSGNGFWIMRLTMLTTCDLFELFLFLEKSKWILIISVSAKRFSAQIWTKCELLLSPSDN